MQYAIETLHLVWFLINNAETSSSRVHTCSVKKVFLKISQISQENIIARVPF